MFLKPQKTNSRKNEGPKEYTCQFWEPGLVSYEDAGAGVALLRKEAMDSMLQSFVGKPVTIEHVDGTGDEIKASGKAVGTVKNAYWNPETGWYECTFTVENEEAQKAVDAGWSVSCAFNVSDQTGPGGEYHALKYNEEITSGEFTHLALVQNPRYEESKIFKNHKMFLNSKGVKTNAFVTKPLFKVGQRIEKGNKFKMGGAVSKVQEPSNDTNGARLYWIKFDDGHEMGPLHETDLTWNSKQNATRKESVLREISELGKLGTLGKDYQKYLRYVETIDLEKEYQGAIKISDIVDNIILRVGPNLNAKENGQPVCPECKKPLTKDGLVYTCQEHGNVTVDKLAWENAMGVFQQLKVGSVIVDNQGEELTVVKVYYDKVTCKDEDGNEMTLDRQDVVNFARLKNSKHPRVILKSAKQKTSGNPEKFNMFGLFKRLLKKNEAPVEQKHPLESVEIEIDGELISLDQLVIEHQAEQTELSEKKRLEEEAAKNADPAQKPAEDKPAGEPAPEDLNLEGQEFSVEDGSRYNMTELVEGFKRRKAAKMNEEKEKEDFLNALDFGDGRTEAEARAKLKEMGYSDAEIEQVIKTKKEGQAASDAKKNEGETPEQKKEREDKEAKENAAKEEEDKKAKDAEEAKAKENAKKKDPKFFHKMNNLKNEGEKVLGKALETVSDKIARGNEKYGSKKK